MTRYTPTGETMPIYDAAMRYKQDGTPLVVIAGKEYGTGSSRDWAAKGTVLLGVRAVIAESYERIHRSNLVGMGVLPLQFHGRRKRRQPRPRRYRDLHDRRRRRHRAAPGCRGPGDPRDGSSRSFTARCRIDTYNELEYFRSGGILQYVLRKLGGLTAIVAGRNCRLGRGRPDLARLSAAVSGQADRAIAGLSVDEPVSARGFRRQRLVARRAAFDGAQLIWMVIGAVALWRIFEKKGSSTSAT